MTNENSTERLHHEEEEMGTVVTFDLYIRPDASRTAIYPQLARATASLHRADAVFSTWKPNSPMNQLRSGETGIGDLPREIADVLQLCLEAKELTNGWFDPWALPGGVDPTGYVKGWAAQRSLEILRDLPLVGAIVNAAGDVACFGGPEEGEGFRVGISDPFATTRLIAVAQIESAIATSGVAERGDHLYDPKARIFRAAAASASVSGPDLGLADALATAIAVGGVDSLVVLATIPDYEAFVVASDGSTGATPNFPFIELGGAENDPSTTP